MLRNIGEGILVAPRRGKPPAAPTGYEADFGNPYVFYAKLPKCEYRKQETLTTNCCRKNIIFCSHRDKRVIRSMCLDCAIGGNGDEA